MQSSWLPEHVCERLDKLNRDFLWSNDIDQRKLHLVGWQKVVLPKSAGGLGIRTARGNNEALLAKIVWKILCNDDTIWFPLIQSKYLKGSHLLKYCVKPGDSVTWKGIMRCVELIKPFIRWHIWEWRTDFFLARQLVGFWCSSRSGMHNNPTGSEPAFV